MVEPAAEINVYVTDHRIVFVFYFFHFSRRNTKIIGIARSHILQLRDNTHIEHKRNIIKTYIFIVQHTLTQLNGNEANKVCQRNDAGGDKNENFI